MYTKNYDPWASGPVNAIDAPVLNNYENGISDLYTWITKVDTDADDLTENNRKVFVDTSSAAFALTLPATVNATAPGTANVGDEVKFVDVAGTFNTNNFTINVAAGDTLMGTVDDNLVLSTDHDYVTLTYSGATYGWVITSKP